MVVIKKIRNKQKKKPTEKKNANKPHKSVASGSQVSKEVEKSLKKEVPRPYNSGWEKEEQFAGWLSPAPPSVLIPNRREAFCRWCQKGLRAHKADLDIHSQTIRHQQRAEELDTSKQKNLTQCGVAKKSDLPKKADIGLAIHLACHSSIRTIDHLSDLLKKLGVGSILEKLQLRRTKASKLILNVIAPAFMKELVDDVGDGCFSIIVDESTDVSCFKYMAYAIKYFSQRTQRIITNFLGFTRVGSATAKQLHLDLKEFLTDSGLDIKKMIGIGTDGASNMCGGNNSLFTLLRESQPSLQLIKCMCHSVALAASKAADELPSELENLVKQSKNYFSHSSLRLEKWEALYKEMNEGNTPLRLVALSTTRWLAFFNAVTVILRQWRELKEFFTNAATSFDHKNTEVRILAEAYKKDDVLLYLKLVETVLRDVMALNIAFQKSNADITALHDDLRTSILSLARRIFKPAFLKPSVRESNPSNIKLHQADLDAVKRAIEKAGDSFENSLLSIDAVDFGLKFSNHAEECSSKKTITTHDLTIVKQRARSYILKLVTELVKRLPHNLEVIEKINYFTPAVCLAQTNSISARDLPWELTDETIDRDEVESQLRKLQTKRLADISPDFSDQVSPEEFWNVVRQMKNKNGERTFKDLANFALRALTLPTSNADIERIFSVMTIVKNKLRNRMLLPMLVAIIRIRVHMRVYGNCCHDYEPTRHMLDLFNSKMYKKNEMEKYKQERESTLTLEAF